MSFMRPMSSIELNLRPKEECRRGSQVSGESVASVTSMDIKQLPKWLLEFDSFSINEPKFKKNGDNRPLTESSVGQRPQWFKEMAQQRRSSDAFASIDAKTDLFTFSVQNLDKNSFTHSARRRRIRRNESNKDKEITRVIENDFKPLPKAIDDNLEAIFQVKPNKNGFKSCENLFFETNEISSEESSGFIIPELPFGQFLELEIMANWGDDDFVGLNGIEILDLSGTELKIDKIWSEPKTDSALGALMDGVYRTHDDSHIWLTQLTSECRLPIKIGINFERKISIALIRIWNYNKSRIYSYRGVKDIDIKLDNKMIFKGEIAKASGTLVAPVESFGDTILFTTDENILEEVGTRDHSFQELVNEIIPLTQ